jgi:uncharacterized cupin superfamily protein
MKRLIAVFVSSALSYTAMADNPVATLPAELSKADIAGKIFQRSDMEQTTHGDGHVTQSVTSLLSSDKNFSTGMYKSGKTRIEISEPYGVDEFMYFLEGSVTLTSSDGTVQLIEAGEGVTVPKEWTGVFETEGYRKIWVIYAGDSKEQ